MFMLRRHAAPQEGWSHAASHATSSGHGGGGGGQDTGGKVSQIHQGLVRAGLK